jgi:hypothetical protein
MLLIHFENIIVLPEVSFFSFANQFNKKTQFGIGR